MVLMISVWSCRGWLPKSDHTHLLRNVCKKSAHNTYTLASWLQCNLVINNELELHSGDLCWDWMENSLIFVCKKLWLKPVQNELLFRNVFVLINADDNWYLNFPILTFILCPCHICPTRYGVSYPWVNQVKLISINIITLAI